MFDATQDPIFYFRNEYSLKNNTKQHFPMAYPSENDVVLISFKCLVNVIFLRF